jgi:hypothetical protein
MRIRDLHWRGDVVWPPEWWPPETDVLLNKDAMLKNVVIQDMGHRYIQVEIETSKWPLYGVILLENPGHLDTLYQKLKENIGKPVTEIGSLEIDLPSLRKYGPKQVRPYRRLRNMEGVLDKKVS